MKVSCLTSYLAGETSGMRRVGYLSWPATMQNRSDGARFVIYLIIQGVTDMTEVNQDAVLISLPCTQTNSLTIS